MGTHASLRGVKPHPVLMDLPTGIDIFVDGRLEAVGKLSAGFQRVIYRRKRRGQFEQRAMVQNMLTTVDGNSRRVYVRWQDCKLANVSTAHVASYDPVVIY